ncbi:MAG TPA: MMPL family transporter, partial [Nitrospirota bacterium]
MTKIVRHLEEVLFSHRMIFLAAFGAITLLLAYSAADLRVDAGFTKMIPLRHEYMKTFTRYQGTFGGANRVLVAVMQREGDIFNPDFFKVLKQVTDDVFFLPGVDRPSVTSLFTPNVRFIEVIEEGFAGGNVVPADFRGTPRDLEEVRRNIVKAGGVGRLVSNDFKGALVRAELLEIDPATGAKLDYQAVAKQLEAIRTKYQSDGIRLHVIGFAKAVGDITDGTRGVIAFFVVAFLITSVLLYWYSGSWKLTVLVLICAMLPVVWLMGLLPVLGYGIDPLSILVPFLIFSIGVSHAVQMANAWKHAALGGADGVAASRDSFRKLLVPGATALATDALGFLVIMHIKIEMVQELGITASLGIALMIITDMLVLPLLLSSVRLSKSELGKAGGREAWPDGIWRRLGRLAERRTAAVVLLASFAVLGLGLWKAQDLQTGDLGKGVPELREDSRYNRDSAAI